MTKPSDVVVSTATPLKVEDANHNLIKAFLPSNANIAKKKPSNPVRNTAFREHEGLRELQKQLNSTRPTTRNSK